MGVPELPEVETVRVTLASLLPGRTVEAVTTDGSTRFAAAAEAVGATITSVRRSGKYLLLGLEDPDARPASGSVGDAVGDRDRDADRELVIHLGMSGQLLVVDPATPSDRYRFRATLVGRPGDPAVTLELRDVRGFGRAAVVPFGDHRELGVLARLGPEPDADDLEPWLVERFAGRQVTVKALLLDQAVIGGVGNIYADEALHRAGIHPEARGGDLRRPAVAALSVAVREVIAEGVANGGTTLRDYRRADGSDGGHQHHLAVYGRDGEPCATCGSAIVKIRVAGRGTHLCPTCQRRPRRRRSPSGGRAGTRRAPGPGAGRVSSP